MRLFRGFNQCCKLGIRTLVEKNPDSEEFYNSKPFSLLIIKAVDWLQQYLSLRPKTIACQHVGTTNYEFSTGLHNTVNSWGLCIHMHSYSNVKDT